MKSIIAIASMIWTAIRYSPTLLKALPEIFGVFKKILTLFPPDKIIAVFKAIGKVIDSASPPAPTADSAGTKPANML